VHVNTKNNKLETVVEEVEKIDEIEVVSNGGYGHACDEISVVS